MEPGSPGSFFSCCGCTLIMYGAQKPPILWTKPPPAESQTNSSRKARVLGGRGRAHFSGCAKPFAASVDHQPGGGVGDDRHRPAVDPAAFQRRDIAQQPQQAVAGGARGGVGIRLEAAAAIVRQYGEQFRRLDAGKECRNRRGCCEGPPLLSSAPRNGKLLWPFFHFYC